MNNVWLIKAVPGAFTKGYLKEKVVRRFAARSKAVTVLTWMKKSFNPSYKLILVQGIEKF